MNAELLWAYHEKRQKGITARQEVELRNQIMLANDRLAKKIARRMGGRCNLPFDDLLQLSRLGMLKAIPKYDPTQNAAFSSFVVPYCEGEIKHFLRDHKNLVKTPRRWQEKSDEVRAIQGKAAKHGRLITIDEAATVGARLPAQQWQTIAAATAQRPMVEIDEKLQIAAEPVLSLEEAEFQESLREALIERLKELPIQTQECIVEKFWGDLNEDVIAKRKNLTITEVNTLIESGLQQLREVV